MRLIDADALIKILEPNSMRNGAVLGWHSGLIDAVIDEIRKMLTIGGWISVKDRLPDKSGTYLCYQPKAASICALNTVRWSEVKGWIGKEVGSRIEGIEYWMPLPEPPEKEK